MRTLINNLTERGIMNIMTKKTQTGILQLIQVKIMSADKYK